MNTVSKGKVRFALTNNGRNVELGPTLRPNLFGLAGPREPGKHEIVFELEKVGEEMIVQITTCDKKPMRYALNAHCSNGAYPLPANCMKIKLEVFRTVSNSSGTGFVDELAGIFSIDSLEAVVEDDSDACAYGYPKKSHIHMFSSGRHFGKKAPHA